jgi:L-methionine (R)-S-oxide reductase
MTEQLIFSANADRAARYEQLLPQLRALIGDEPSLVANLANVAAALRQTFGFFWVGFYLVDGDQLVLGPFQGEIACTRIAFGKGVCGTAWKENRTILVPDVNAFPGHIACSSASLSEIVVPIRGRANVVAVLDVDSDTLNDFSDSDKQGLEQISELLSPLFQ